MTADPIRTTSPIRAAAASSLVVEVYRTLDAALQLGLSLDVQRSDFALRLLTPLVIARWKGLRGTCPPPRSSLSPQDHAVLSQLLDGHFHTQLMHSAERCSQVVRRLAELLSSHDARATPRAFSEAICVWVKSFILSGASPTDAECDSFASELWLGALGPRPLDAATFESLHARAWDVLWADVGAGHLRAYPPSAVMLGHDRRPPLVDHARRGGRRNWFQGTDRAVYDRYRLAFWGTPRVPPACSDPSCRRPRIRTEDDAAAAIERACAVYGLNEISHQVIIRSVADGLSHEPSALAGWTTWEEWASPCRAVGTGGQVDHGLVDAIESAFAAWATSDVGGPLKRQYGIGILTRPISTITVRRLWMDLHRRESHGQAPLRRCGIARPLRAILYRHMPGALKDWFTGELGEPDVDAESPASDPSGDATLALLTANPGVVRLMMDGNLAWRDRYGDLVRHSSSGAGAYCDPDATFGLVQQLIRGMRT